jgi:hypothetical protein
LSCKIEFFAARKCIINANIIIRNFLVAPTCPSFLGARGAGPFDKLRTGGFPNQKANSKWQKYISKIKK